MVGTEMLRNSTNKSTAGQYYFMLAP